MANITDNQIYTVIIPIIKAGLIANGQKGVAIMQSWQPTQQGVPKGSAVFLSKIMNRRVGFVQRRDVWDAENSVMLHKEIQYIEASHQVSVLAPQNPEDIKALTASDLINLVASIISSDDTRVKLKAVGVSMLRVADIRNPYFSDDRDRYEASPSFDFVLAYEQIYTTEIPVIQSTEFHISSV